LRRGKSRRKGGTGKKQKYPPCGEKVEKERKERVSPHPPSVNSCSYAQKQAHREDNAGKIHKGTDDFP
jgi:hypothetical protein